MPESASVFSMFCVGHGSTVNIDVLSARRKHEKTLPNKKKIVYFLFKCQCFLVVSCMVQNHRKYRHLISAKKTWQNTKLLFTFAVVLYIFHAFYEVWCRAREHRKLRHFNTAKKTRKNTMVLCRLSIILYFRRVVHMLFCILFNSKTCELRPHEKRSKLQWYTEADN